MNTNKIYDCIVIGGGASGLFFGAVTELNKPGLQAGGLILEKTGRAGTKLLMSGSGQCNITHGGSIKDFLQCYSSSGYSNKSKDKDPAQAGYDIKTSLKAGGRIRKALYRHSNLELIEFLENNGLKTFTRDDGKVFPKSMDAHDVLRLLAGKVRDNGFELKTSQEVVGIEGKGELWEIRCASGSADSRKGRVYKCRNLVIATGGASYPTTGSDGSFFDIIRRDLGIAVTDISPALTPVQVRDYPYGELSGISFQQARVTIAQADGSKPVNHDGGLLFTHKDFSGPALLNISKYARTGGKVTINYMWPGSYDEILARLTKAASKSSSAINNVISSEFHLPARFARSLTERYGNSIKKLAGALTGESFTIHSVSGFRTAMTTCGGIALSELDLNTFMISPGLYAIGEACDIDAITGGYSLQFAYSSACAASDDIMANL